MYKLECYRLSILFQTESRNVIYLYNHMLWYIIYIIPIEQLNTFTYYNKYIKTDHKIGKTYETICTL